MLGKNILKFKLVLFSMMLGLLGGCNSGFGIIEQGASLKEGEFFSRQTDPDNEIIANEDNSNSSNQEQEDSSKNDGGVQDSEDPSSDDPLIIGCGVGKYKKNASCKVVEVGFYSPANDDQKYRCEIPNNSVALSSGGGDSQGCDWECKDLFDESGGQCRSLYTLRNHLPRLPIDILQNRFFRRVGTFNESSYSWRISPLSGVNAVYVDKNYNTQFGYPLVYNNISTNIAVYQTLRAKPDHTYKLTVLGRNQYSSTSGVVVALQFLNSSGQVLGQDSVAVESTSWESSSMTLRTPSGANKVKVLMRRNATSTGKSYLKNLSLYEVPTVNRPIGKEIELYVSRSGSRDFAEEFGRRSRYPAKYNDPNFWNHVNELLMIMPVKVVFSNQTYCFSIVEDLLQLNSIGNTTNRLTITGKYRDGTVFMHSSGSDTCPGGVLGSSSQLSRKTLFIMRSSNHIVVKDIHYRSGTSGTVGYLAVVRNESENVTFQNISAYDIRGIDFGAFGPNSRSENINLIHSEMINIGYDTHAHFVYCANDVLGVRISENYFEGVPGAYVRARNNCNDFHVLNNIFINTDSRRPKMVEVATFNDGVKIRRSDGSTYRNTFGDETLPTRIQVKNNYFQSRAGQIVVFNIHHSGFNPGDNSARGRYSHEYLFTNAQRGNFSSGTESYKIDLLQRKLNTSHIQANLVFSNNTCVNSQGSMMSFNKQNYQTASGTTNTILSSFGYIDYTTPITDLFDPCR